MRLRARRLRVPGRTYDRDMRLPWLASLLFAACLAHAQNPAAPQPIPPHPAEPPAPPDVRTLMLDVEKQERGAEDVTRDYTYRVHMVNQEFNRSGKPKKTVTTDAESFTIDGVRVNKVVARDGKPLPPKDAQKEDEAVDKTVARAKDQRARLTAKGKASDSRGEEVLTVSRILELGTFSNLHPGEYAGRPVWIVEYAGNPDAKTHTEFEKVFRDLVGTVWIDQKDHVVVAIKGHFLKDFRIGGGILASISKNTHFTFLFTRLDDKVWVIDSFDAEGSFHYLLFGGFSGRIHGQTSDYRKFRSSARLDPNVHEVDTNVPGAPAR